MIPDIQEIDPLSLLYNPYQPMDRNELAQLLGVTVNTIYSWQEGRPNPSRTVKILAATLLNRWQSQQKRHK